MNKRYFTLEEAQSLIPWLNSAFESIRNRLSKNELANQSIEQKRHQLHSNGTAKHEETFHQTKNDSINTNKEINNILNEINNRGILIKKIDDGLVDFPYIINNKEVYFFWISTVFTFI